MLTLLVGGYHAACDPAPLHRAARYLMSRQQVNGDWPQQHISGVFNRNCMITYANYRCGLHTPGCPWLYYHLALLVSSQG
jgi:cycloartenol synthase